MASPAVETSGARLRIALTELRLASAAWSRRAAGSFQARAAVVAARSGSLLVYLVASGLVPVRRAFARIEGATVDEAISRYPAVAKPTWMTRAIAPPPVTPLANETSKPAPRPMSDERSVSAVERQPLKRTLPVAEQILPPNIARALSSQLAASHKDKLANEDVQRYLTAFGLLRGDASVVVGAIAQEQGRDFVMASDLPQLQRLVEKRWIATRRRDRVQFEKRLRDQLELPAVGAIDAAMIEPVLVQRGYRAEDAARLAELLTKSTVGSLR